MALLSNLLSSKKLIDPVEMPATAQIIDATANGLYPAQAIECVNKYRLVIRPILSASTVSCKARIAFMDTTGLLIGYSDELDIQNTAIPTPENASKYHGTLFVVANELGASSFKIRITSAPSNSGKVTFYCGVA